MEEDEEQYNFGQTVYDDEDWYEGAPNQYFQQQQMYSPYQEEHFTGQAYEILPQTALLKQLMELVKRAAELTGLHQGWCLILLNQFKWNLDFINDKYFDKADFYKNKIGWNPNFGDPFLISHSDSSTCAVCCQQKILLYYICGHRFCQNCWIEHISSHVNSGILFIKCMGCSTPLLYQVIKSILSQNPKIQNKKIIDRYEKKLCQLFTTINHSYQCCIGTDCTNCIRTDNLTITTVRCPCGKCFCFKCKADDHSPCTCEEKKVWLDLVMKEEADAKWISVNTKMCPWCKKNVERSAGCNFMACVCGKSFCYMCSKPWEPDHKDHFKCHIYKKKSDENTTKEKEVLAKMNFYAEKYLNNNAITSHLKKVDSFERRKCLFDNLDIALTQSQFIDQAYKFAIECCESLKWIYAYSYFLDFEQNNQKKEQFEFSQGQFEKYKQELLKKLSYDMKNLLDNLNNKIKLNQLDKNQEIQKFKILKKSIVNYYTSTKSFKGKFIIQIENMDIKQKDQKTNLKDKQKEKEKEKEKEDYKNKKQKK